jgi:transposase InsO family protein
MTRRRAEGDLALEPRSRRPGSSPRATPQATVDVVLRLRKHLAEAGLDGGADTIAWHLHHHHGTQLSRATINHILTRAGAVVPQPAKRPRSSYIRFQAELPNQCWQSDFTHYRLAPSSGRDGRPGGRRGGRRGVDVEIITWLDDHSRMALHISAHQRITAPIVLTSFRQAIALHGIPASTLTDNGMVYTVRLASRTARGGRTGLEHELRRLGIVQKNSRPNHPTTCGKVERFQQTMKKWLRAQPVQPRTITELQALIDTFKDEYNQRRPHRSLPHHATPATAYHARPKATPTTAGTDRTGDTHDRVRTDRIDNTGCVTATTVPHVHRDVAHHRQ